VTVSFSGSSVLHGVSLLIADINPSKVTSSTQTHNINMHSIFHKAQILHYVLIQPLPSSTHLYVLIAWCLI